MHPLESRTLRGLLSAGSGSEMVQLVFVSACYSEASGRAFVDAGVKHVIAVKMGAKVADRSSRTFMEQFYLALFVSRCVACCRT